MSIQPTTAHSNSDDSLGRESPEQLDRELLVAERIRDYSDEIYMHTRQQWIDWKRRVDRERSAASDRGNHHSQYPNHNGHATAHSNHQAGRGNNNKHVIPGVSINAGVKHGIEPVTVSATSSAGGAVKARQEPFNFYGPTSPVSELVHPQSDSSD